MTDLRDSIFNYIIKSMEKNKNSYFLSIDQGSFGYEILKKNFLKDVSTLELQSKMQLV